VTTTTVSVKKMDPALRAAMQARKPTAHDLLVRERADSWPMLAGGEEGRCGYVGPQIARVVAAADGDIVVRTDSVRRG